MRSGDEPLHARSPLRLRLGLAVMGLVFGAVLAARAWADGWAAGAWAAGAVAAGALVNAVIVIRRIRSGPHYQPGPDVPPYRPVVAARRPPRGPAGPVPAGVPQAVRQRRYLFLMGGCLALITVAWGWVRLVSTTAAVVLSLVAMVIPPIAAIIANAGRDGRR